MHTKTSKANKLNSSFQTSQVATQTRQADDLEDGEIATDVDEGEILSDDNDGNYNLL